MIALPIVVRELRVAARRDSTYWTRLSVAFASIFIGGYGLAVSQTSLGAGVGPALFSIFSWIGVFYCVAVGLRNSADSMSEEKREGTLGLLFLTDLKGYDIILGKLAATGVHSFYGFLAAFPVFSICLMLGGVTGAQFWQTSLALLNIFFFAHAVGLLSSTFSRQARKSYVAALLLALFFFIGLPSLEAFIQKSNSAAHWVQLLNPGMPFVMAQQAYRTGHSGLFWGCLALTHGISWGFLALASWRAPYCWQDRPSSLQVGWRKRLDDWTCGSGESRKAFRYKLTAINPFYWLISRNRLSHYTVWITLGLGACFWAWLWYAYWRTMGGPRFQAPVCIFTIGIMHTVFKFFVASEATRHFEEQRRSGALEFLLACTPLKAQEILHGHFLALRRHFVWPGITILALDGLMILGIGVYGGSSSDGTTRAWVLASMFVFVADVIAISWLGMWLGLSKKKARRASGATILRILLLPWVLFMVFGRVTFAGGVEGALTGYVLSSLVVDAFFILVAKTNLETQFREHCEPQRDENLGVLAKLGGALGMPPR